MLHRAMPKVGLEVADQRAAMRTEPHFLPAKLRRQPRSEKSCLGAEALRQRPCSTLVNRSLGRRVRD